MRLGKQKLVRLAVISLTLGTGRRQPWDPAAGDRALLSGTRDRLEGRRPSSEPLAFLTRDDGGCALGLDQPQPQSDKRDRKAPRGPDQLANGPERRKQALQMLRRRLSAKQSG